MTPIHYHYVLFHIKEILGWTTVTFACPKTVTVKNDGETEDAYAIIQAKTFDGENWSFQWLIHKDGKNQLYDANLLATEENINFCKSQL